MGIIGSLTTVGRRKRLLQIHFHLSSERCLIWKGSANSLVVLSSFRSGAIPLWRIGYDRAIYVRLRSEGGMHHGFPSSRSACLAGTGLGASLARSSTAYCPTLRTTSNSCRACPRDA